jgi:hypothetical protein
MVANIQRVSSQAPIICMCINVYVCMSYFVKLYLNCTELEIGAKLFLWGEYYVESSTMLIF